MCDLLSEELFQHYSKLVSAIRQMSSTSVSLDQVDEAGEQLEAFSEDFERLYGKGYLLQGNLYLRLHQVDHLVIESSFHILS